MERFEQCHNEHTSRYVQSCVHDFMGRLSYARELITIRLGETMRRSGGTIRCPSCRKRNTIVVSEESEQRSEFSRGLVLILWAGSFLLLLLYLYAGKNIILPGAIPLSALISAVVFAPILKYASKPYALPAPQIVYTCTSCGFRGLSLDPIYYGSD